VNQSGNNNSWQLPVQFPQGSMGNHFGKPGHRWAEVIDEIAGQDMKVRVVQVVYSNTKC